MSDNNNIQDIMQDIENEFKELDDILKEADEANQYQDDDYYL